MHFLVWEQRKLGELAEQVTGNNGNITNLPVLTISAANGWMLQKERFSQVIAGSELKRYTLLKQNELSYNHGNSKLAKFGAVFMLKGYKRALVPKVYHSFKLIDNNSPEFIETVFATHLPDSELGKIITSGARMDGLLNIGKNAFFNIQLNIPSVEEQRYITHIFSRLNSLITLQQRKLKLLKLLKKAMLQRMFADKEYPEIRFKCFTNAWLRTKIGKITTTEAYKPYIAQAFKVGKYKVIQQGETPIAGYADGNPFEDYKTVTLFGDHTLSLYKPQAPFFIASDGVKILQPAIKMNNLFYYYLLIKNKPKSEGYKRHFSILKNKTVLYTKQIVEQKEISKYFNLLDLLIAIQQNKLNKLKTLKKFLLQNMFI